MSIEKVKIWVQVQPNARWNEVHGEKDGIWQLKIAAPPVKGRANAELVRFLSDVLQISKSNLAIGKGLRSQRKLINISNLTLEQVKTRFNAMTRQKRSS